MKSNKRVSSKKRNPVFWSVDGDALTQMCFVSFLNVCRKKKRGEVHSYFTEKTPHEWEWDCVSGLGFLYLSFY